MQTFKDFVAQNGPAKLYPHSEWALRNLYRNRQENGLDGAFRKAGGTLLVDREKFYALLRSLV